MIALTAQAAIATLHLIFAVLAFRIARSLMSGERAFQFGWSFTALVFLLRGLNMGAHAIFSIIAYRSGPGTAMWNATLVVNPILNHSRTFLLTAYCLILTVILFRAARGRPFPSALNALGLVLCGMFVGAFVGFNEEAFSALTHYTAVAGWDIMELLALMALLFVGLTTGGMDRGLWAALGVNAFVLSLSVLWFAYLSRIDVGGQWAPRPYQIHVFKALLYVMMIGVAYRQWRNLRRGKPARAFLDLDPRRPAASLHG